VPVVPNAPGIEVLVWPKAPGVVPPRPEPKVGLFWPKAPAPVFCPKVDAPPPNPPAVVPPNVFVAPVPKALGVDCG
jgi:hypothetical protein